jgi:hypothetical protein
MISEFEIDHPDVKQSMISALGKVVPTHLLDRTLNPPRAAVAAAAARITVEPLP